MSNKLITKEYLEKQLKNYKSQVLVKNFVSHEDGKELFSGSYNDLTDKPDIPTVTNDLTDELKAFYDDTVLKSHEHTNDNVLDKFSENEDGNLLFNGKGIQGEAGRSIVSIDTDESNNVIVTFSDNTTKYIGQLKNNISADLLSEDGFGNIRYYNEKFQCYDANSSSWVDIQPTDNNALILNLAPQPMQKMHLLFDVDTGFYTITFKEPLDTIVDNQMLVCVEGIKFVRKLGSEPENVDDGILVLDYKRKNFASYNKTTYIDKSFTARSGENWFYKAFPYSNNGHYGNSSNNVSSCVCRSHWLFGFKLDQNESEPSNMISYLDDCDNACYDPVYMDYETGIFNYGDWEDAFFIRNIKPCMLNYDGTVAYELDPNDYSKKLNGALSDIENINFEGNVMIGIPKVYYKIVDNGDNTANIYFSNKKIDTNFYCWSHIDNNGKEIDYCYMPAYNGCNQGNKLRSLSGQKSVSISCIQEIELALANNIDSNIIWNTEVYSDRMLINLLLLLIGKSTDTQAVFGNGYYTGGSQSNNQISTGSMNTKGLFWGHNSFSKNGVKVFGMENFWGNQARKIAGWINDKGTQKIKLTYGKQDGSTVIGYNTDGTGYITVGCTPSGTSGGYIREMTITKYGLIPTIAKGSSTTYYSDTLDFNNSIVGYAFVGGHCSSSLGAGAFWCNFNNNTGSHYWVSGSAVSCKPLKK